MVMHVVMVDRKPICKKKTLYALVQLYIQTICVMSAESYNILLAKGDIKNNELDCKSHCSNMSYISFLRNRRYIIRVRSYTYKPHKL